MSERAQLDHVLLDVDFMHKPTIRTFRRKFGWVSITWIIEVYCLMSRATNAIVTRDTMLCVAEDMRLDNGDDMINEAINLGLIIQLEDNEDPLFTNSRVIKDQESLYKKRKENKERQEKYRNKTQTQPVSNALHNAFETVSPDTVSVTDTDTDRSKLLIVSPPSTGSVGGVHRVPQELNLDDFQKEAALQKLKEFGLGAHDLVRMLFILQGWYSKNPHKYNPKNLIFDLCSPWLTKVMLEEKTAAKRLQNANNGPPKAEMTGAEIIALAKKRREEKTKDGH